MGQGRDVVVVDGDAMSEWVVGSIESRRNL